MVLVVYPCLLGQAQFDIADLGFAKMATVVHRSAWVRLVFPNLYCGFEDSGSLALVYVGVMFLYLVRNLL